MILFKQLTVEMLPLLFTWLCQPHTAMVWPEPKVWPEFEKEWSEQLTTKFRYIAYLDNEPLGYIEYFHLSADDRKIWHRSNIATPAIGTNLFVADPNKLGKGYGARMMVDIMKIIKEREPECKAVIMDIPSENHRAIAHYEKAGFKKQETYLMQYGNIPDLRPLLLMIYNFE